MKKKHYYWAGGILCALFILLGLSSVDFSKNERKSAKGLFKEYCLRNGIDSVLCVNVETVRPTEDAGIAKNWAKFNSLKTTEEMCRDILFYLDQNDLGREMMLETASEAAMNVKDDNLRRMEQEKVDIMKEINRENEKGIRNMMNTLLQQIADQMKEILDVKGDEYVYNVMFRHTKQRMHFILPEGENELILFDKKEN